MNELLSTQNQIWLKRFLKIRGRKPRVLLIGNIANNAYNDAKILSEASLDCDVICYDYYHVMGCPEWEDADFPSSPTDDFRPDWTSIPLQGYTRPRWFAQGPLYDCIAYLVAKRAGRPEAEYLWKLLLGYSKVVHFHELGLPSLSMRRISLKLRLKTLWLDSLQKLHLHQPRLYFTLRGARRLARRILLIPRPLVQCWRKAMPFSPKLNSTAPPQATHLPERFLQEFPHRIDHLTLEDLEIYMPHLNAWLTLFQNYDFILAFSTDPIWPLLCNRPYFAVEHGTLRDIPFTPDAQGRRTALAYRLASHTFVTNFDCAKNAEMLAPGRYTLINHPYDEDHGLTVSGAMQQRAELLQQLAAEFLFFHPTRQDWVDGTGYADKRNEVFLQAFAQLRQAGIRVGLLACSWGSNVRESQALLAELGCDAYVKWVPPQAITPFERLCMACDVVVDQFKLGAFGGVVFKAMAVGTPIITYIKEDLLVRQYAELPPLINCQTAEEIVSEVRNLIHHPQRLKHLSAKSRDWIKRNHGKRETINKQVDQFRLHSNITADSSLDLSH